MCGKAVRQRGLVNGEGIRLDCNTIRLGGGGYPEWRRWDNVLSDGGENEWNSNPSVRYDDDATPSLHRAEHDMIPFLSLMLS